MERLAAEERKRPQIDWGIFRTHPITRERVETIKRALQEYGIPIRRREVSPALAVHALMENKEQPDGLYTVQFEKIRIFTPASHTELGSSRARAERIAGLLNTLLDDGVRRPARVVASARWAARLRRVRLRSARSLAVEPAAQSHTAC
jgi:hypothetical protein